MTAMTDPAAQEVLANDGHRISIRSWPVDGTPVGVVQILHGLAEHIGRYDRFAHTCNERGYAVFGHNHRGHGEQSGNGLLGHFADEDGWYKVIGDAGAVHADIRRQYPAMPYLLFGHSMGSYIAQSFVMRKRPGIDALVLSGSTWPNKQEVTLGRWLARLMKAFRGSRTRSRLFDEMIFKKYNSRFAPNRTAFDWLSRDDTEVDRYVDDPLCGSRSTYGLWFALFTALLEISAADAIAGVPKTLPVLITGGERDPVGGKRALSRLAAEYEASGHEQLTLRLYDNGRHELLNETNRREVTEDLLAWMDTALSIVR